MTIRKDVSVVEPLWNNSQRVTQEDLQTDQQHNDQITAAIINNHFGSGVLPFSPEQVTLFDSDNLPANQATVLAAGNFDGYGLNIHTQPTDTNLGNQLEVELSGSNVFGRLPVKVAIIGLSFDGTLQMDRLYFYVNEKQVTSKHYARILTVFFNDFLGNNNCSQNQGGRITIKEAASFQLSRNCKTVSQDYDPDIFWRDFKISDQTSTLEETIQEGMGDEFSITALNVTTGGIPEQQLVPDDVTTQVGQKFQAKTNNIQKITLLLGVKQGDGDSDVSFDWSGDILISVYPLQTTVQCSTDIQPALLLDFDPEPRPIAQISYNQQTLEDYGYVLNNVLQPIDFVFSSTVLGLSGTGAVIVPDNFYCVTVKRSGNASSGTILVGVGNDRLDDSRMTLFSGVWVDVPERDCYFQIWSDAAKVSSGSGYDGGNGIMYSKTKEDEETGAQVDYSAEPFALANTGEGVLNTGVLQAVFEESEESQNERTGSPIETREMFVPSFSFVTDDGLASLRSVSEPFVIGAVEDRNPKANPAELTKENRYPGTAVGNSFIIINPDADLLSLNLLGSKLIPNSDNAQHDYKIFKATYCIDGYGDVNGDSEIDSSDIARAAELIGESLNYTSTQEKIRDGYITTLELIRSDVDGDGYITSNDVTLITNYVNRVINSFPVGTSFNHLTLEVEQNIGRSDGYYNCSSSSIRLDGYNGLNIVAISSLSSDTIILDGYYITPTIQSVDSAFTQVPFEPIDFTIKALPFWQDYLLVCNSDARKVACTFSSNEESEQFDCDASSENCVQKDLQEIGFDPGRNDFYIPDNLIIDKGQILKPDGSVFSTDWEIGSITLNLPETPLSEANINIFSKFIYEVGDGKTTAGYDAMKYSDCSFVQAEDLALGKIRFAVSIQSIATNLDGYDGYGYGVVVDNQINCFIDHTTGILTLTAKDLEADEVYKSMITKIQVTVFLKKAGFKNTPLSVEPSALVGLTS